VVASGASLLLYRVLVNHPQPTKSAAAPQIAVAARDIEIGTVLTEKDVKLADWPSAIPAGATARVQDLIGRGAIMAIYDKEPVIETRLAPRGAGGGLASMIPPGMRAVAVHVNDVVGVAGFVVAGMRVDILISGNSPLATMAWEPLPKRCCITSRCFRPGRTLRRMPKANRCRCR